MRKKLIPFIAVLLLMASCSMNKKITYFQDVIVSSDSTVTEKLPPEITLRPEDKVSIVVNSKDPELSNLFNLPYVTRTIGSSSEDGSVRGVSNYVVRRDGTIDFPVLGSVKVAGLTRDEVAAHIKNQLISQNLVNDPVVTVEFVNLQYSVMGEVRAPGNYKITRDRITLLEAISQAGDLNISGKRDNVLVIRADSTGKLYAYNANVKEWQTV
jgi:polysaccharide export outer membrane protein